MFFSGICLLNYKKNNISPKIKKILISFIKSNNQFLKSLSKNYKYSYQTNTIKKYKKINNFRVIGMGGSILGTQTIYEFLEQKIKKKFKFIKIFKISKKIKKYLNLIVSKSEIQLKQ